ncbi:hypothetical protein ADIAG_03563 [Paeniglutamicibacter gangotriensis Lz1y]|uniref:Uncharacterized protein n=1 Tax=Paeniglutamicibacter gangotriensis Lz1y TaxID=1276920 RepID=M7N5K2_9MICC|nr:hypothetical protein ADIAG_03563 [Paeniglutamicibacter gangotriensis Lz1y]
MEGLQCAGPISQGQVGADQGAVSRFFQRRDGYPASGHLQGCLSLALRGQNGGELVAEVRAFAQQPLAVPRHPVGVVPRHQLPPVLMQCRPCVDQETVRVICRGGLQRRGALGAKKLHVHA